MINITFRKVWKIFRVLYKHRKSLDDVIQILYLWAISYDNENYRSLQITTRRLTEKLRKFD